jgi:3',5'-nucleoside bisphosphate phosphatase
MDLDLHIHSTASDGTVSPATVVRDALEAGLDVIALTDHDTIHGVPEAIAAAEGHPIAVLPAIEISTSVDERELHILGYVVDPSHPELLEHSARAGDRRRERLREMVARLHDQGIEVPFGDVLDAVPEGGAPGRPHLARAMVTAGIVEDVPEAFDRFIGNDHPAYVPAHLLDPAGAIQLIRRAGGLSFWAHPDTRLLDEMLPYLCSSGLDGLEIHRPWIPAARVQRLEAAVRNWSLLVSGGSDWHGPEGGPLGEFRIGANEVQGFLEAAGM